VLPVRHKNKIALVPEFQCRIPGRRTRGSTPFSAPMDEKNKLDLEAEALTALEEARAIPHGRERTEALKKAGMLQNGAVAQGIAFAKRGRPAKT
jgi:hypothetical protein